MVGVCTWSFILIKFIEFQPTSRAIKYEVMGNESVE